MRGTRPRRKELDMSEVEFLAQNAWKATAILAAGYAASWMMRKRPASVRHFSWAAAFGALLLLPPLTLLTPQWGWRQAPAARSAVVVRSHAIEAQSVRPLPRTSPIPRSWRLLLW